MGLENSEHALHSLGSSGSCSMGLGPAPGVVTWHTMEGQVGQISVELGQSVATSRVGS